MAKREFTIEEKEALKNLIFDENTDGSIDKIVDFKTNELGQIIEIELDYNEDNNADAKIYFAYDKEGRIEKRMKDKNLSGKIHSIEIYEYDENGKVIIHYDDNADGKIDFIEKENENGENTITDVRSTVQKITETTKEVLFELFNFKSK